ncbi:MAG: PP2C family protein-serine/threonine phosphatase [Ignavibacteriota bacterium]
MYSPEDTMRGVDSVMAQMLGEEQYLTACLARLNWQTHRLSIISAGHPPLILVSRAGASQTVELDSDPLGIFGGAILQRTDIKVARGDRFFMYSDGLIESSPGGGRREGLQRLVEACVGYRDLPLADAVQEIVKQVAGCCATDDLLLLAAEVGQ